MLTPEFFIKCLKNIDVDFFVGVPDSLLKNICAYISANFDEKHNIIAANEGAAVGIAAGYHLATGKIPVVYMQNSGLGNTINPLASLIDKEVYKIPLLLLIGWRGEPGIKDEPQHKKQGRITQPLLETMEINHAVLSSDDQLFHVQLSDAIKYIKDTNEPFAFIIKNNTFDTYTLENDIKSCLSMTREEAIQIVASSLGETDVVVSTTGMISRELYEYREIEQQGHQRDFLTVGSMGHASQIALGISLQKENRKVFCFDGDGATIMHMGSLPIIGNLNPPNFYHIVFNNGAHDSVGGQPTVGFKIDIPAIAKASGYKNYISINDRSTLIEVLPALFLGAGPVLIEIQVLKGNRKELGRPTTTPIQNKISFMNFLK